MIKIISSLLIHVTVFECKRFKPEVCSNGEYMQAFRMLSMPFISYILHALLLQLGNFKTFAEHDKCRFASSVDQVQFAHSLFGK